MCVAGVLLVFSVPDVDRVDSFNWVTKWSV